jgi:hypothetical protein
MLNAMRRFFLIVIAAASVAAGCAGPGWTPIRGGMSEAEVVAAWGPPTARHALPAGTRLEWSRAPEGRETWMLDLDPQGRAVLWRQVLSYANLQAVQGRLAGMSQQELLATLGNPSQRRVDRRGGEVWSWTHDSPFCLWFQASINQNGRVSEAAFAPDPRCDFHSPD